MEGWLKLHRCIEEWKWVNDLPTLRLWLYILDHARHEDGSWNGVPLKAGQLVIGRKSFSSETGISEQTYRTSLRRLKDDGTITTEATNKYTIVTVENWGFYQRGEEKSTSISPSVSTSNQPATNQQLTTNKNVKNEKMSAPPPTPSKGETPDGGAGDTADDAFEYAKQCLKYVRKNNVDDWCALLSPALVKHAVDEACAYGNYFWGYAEAILTRYYNKGIHTVEAAKKSDGLAR